MLSLRCLTGFWIHFWCPTYILEATFFPRLFQTEVDDKLVSYISKSSAIALYAEILPSFDSNLIRELIFPLALETLARARSRSPINCKECKGLGVILLTKQNETECRVSFGTETTGINTYSVHVFSH